MLLHLHVLEAIEEEDGLVAVQFHIEATTQICFFIMTKQMHIV